MEYVPPVNGDTGDPDRPYIDANPSLGEEGSIANAHAVEHPMREIVNAIIGAGLTPNGANLAQLLAAIMATISGNVAPNASDTVKGLIEIATPAEAQAGSATDKALVPSNFVGSLGTNGYVRLPGGLILQWGTVTSVNIQNTNIPVTFPMAFPTAIYHARVIFKYPAAIGDNSMPIILTSGYGTSGMNVIGDGGPTSSGTVDAMWFAMGS